VVDARLVGATASRLGTSRSAPEVSADSQGWMRGELRAPLLLFGALLVHHGTLWLLVSRHRRIPLGALLNHWDAGHYSIIIHEGQHGDEWAFLPLYPLLVKGVAWLTGTLANPQFAGSAISTVLLVAFIVAVVRRAPLTPGIMGLAPRTNWGWFLFLYSPASYVFHTQHTESLYLLLSFLAFSLGGEGRGLAAGIYAGLSLLTRIQGLLVAPTAAWLSARAKGERPLRSRQFWAGAAASALFFAVLLGYEYAGAGDAMAFMTAHYAWTHAHSLAEVVKTFWLGNPWQYLNDVSVTRELFWFGWVAMSLWLLKRQPALATYCLLSAAILPMQAELINAFRYGVVLFPLAFIGGDWLAERPIWLRWSIAALVVGLNHWTTLEYSRMGWAY
jgi:hypothetical protein